MHKDASGQDGRELLQGQRWRKRQRIHIAATIRAGLKERLVMEVRVEQLCRVLWGLLNMTLDLFHRLQEPGPHTQMEGRRHLNPDAELRWQVRRWPPEHAPRVPPPPASAP